MSDDAPELLSVEVAFAMPQEQRIVAVKVPPGTSAIEAVQLSGIQQYFPDLALNDGTKLGIFAQLVAHTQALNDGDRVEIYRPLTADPKEVRKERAARAKARRELASATKQDS
jgi:putative ubiquitin-RnfH superfamily antitoxin RatB of RatAB toxin-antitoxin module